MKESQKLVGIDRWQEVLKTVPKETLQFPPRFTHHLKYNTRHLLIAFSRYKFAARLLGDNPPKSVLELGCNEGIGTLCLAEVASRTVAVDFDAKVVKWANKNLARANLIYLCANFLGKNFGKFDAVVSLDVIEHIERKKEDLFLSTVINNLNDEGFAVIGTPNITAAPYASDGSRIGHINLYGHEKLKRLLLKGFKNVFLFGMNDEVVHTGFYPMAHYLIGLAVGVRRVTKS